MPPPLPNTSPIPRPLLAWCGQLQLSMCLRLHVCLPAWLPCWLPGCCLLAGVLAASLPVLTTALPCPALPGAIAQSLVEDVVAGPLRIWPGGLAMARSIGDVEAGALAIAEPEIRQITLPLSGARLIIASDGLWDAITPKTVINQVWGGGACMCSTCACVCVWGGRAH